MKPFPASRNRLFRLLLSWWRALRIVGANRADIYHFHDPELLVTGALAKALWRKHVVFDAHEDPELVRLKPYIPKTLRSIAASVTVGADRILAARFDGIVTATKRLEEKYERFARRCVTFHNFPAPLFLEERDRNWCAWPERRPEVVHLGTASLHRLPHILSIARGFLEVRPEWTFRLFGLSAAQLRACKELLPDDCGGRLLVEGLLKHEDVARVLCRARLGFNFHLLDSEQVRVALPVKVVEYLACGLPTVSTRVPLLLEMFERSGAIHWCEDTVEDAIEVLVATAGRPTLEASGAAGRAVVDEGFSCRAEAQRLTALYGSVLGPAAPRNS